MTPKDKAKLDEIRHRHANFDNNAIARDGAMLSVITANNDRAELLRQLDARDKLIERVRVALKECADELSEWVEANYAEVTKYPGELMRYRRDVAPVNEARAILAELDGERP